jgi:hypothetical protein
MASPNYTIVVLNMATQPDSSFYCTGVFWLTANANDIVPLPGFVSQVPFIDVTDLGLLQTGQLVEQGFNSGLFAAGTSLATVQAALQTDFTNAQTALSLLNPALANLVGTAYTGSAWTGSSPFNPAYTNVVSGALGALSATVQIALAGNMQSVGMQLTAGTLIGSIIAETSTDNGANWNQALFNVVSNTQSLNGLKTYGWSFGSANGAFAATIVVNGGVGLVRVRVFAYTSGTCTVTFRASNINDPSIALYTSSQNQGAPPQIVVAGGLSSAQGLGLGITRPNRVDRIGTSRDGLDTLLAHDAIEGATVNSWLWTQATTTMTIAQTTGVLTLNNAGTLTTTTDAILTTNRQFPIYNHGVLKFAMRANAVSGPTNAFIELGLGAPAGTTAIINNGAFFRLNGTALKLVTSFNGTENVVANAATVSTTEYYLWLVYVEDDFVHFIVEDSSGTPIVDAFVAYPTTVTGVAAVSHLPAFARVYNSAAVATAAKLNIGSYDTYLLDVDTSKPWSHQLASTGRSANIVPTTFAQAAQLAVGAAPTTSTPANTTVAYSTLGGEYSLNVTASSENLLGVFGYQVPSPYILHVTDILLPTPFITTGLGATVNIQEWCVMVASSNNPSTATGQRYTLGMFSAAASAVAGTVLSGLPLSLGLGTPIVVPAGQFLLLLVKMISGSAVGVYRGSVLINGYYE